jgi:arylsulfatase A-like enzyme
LGLDKDTVVVVVSDHGHQLGEKGYTGKIQSGLLPCLMDLVLMIRHPEGKGAGQAVDSLVYGHDILPTVCNLIGEQVPEWTDGEDLWPLVTGEKSQIREYVDSIFKDYAWIRDDEFAMISKLDRTDIELFDLKNDPEYHTNVADRYPDIVDKMWARLLEDAGGDIPFYNIPVPLLDGKK